MFFFLFHIGPKLYFASLRLRINSNECGLSSTVLLLNIPGALRKTGKAALTQFAVYCCCWNARGNVAMLKINQTLKKKKERKKMLQCTMMQGF